MVENQLETLSRLMRGGTKESDRKPESRQSVFKQKLESGTLTAMFGQMVINKLPTSALQK
jgi:hypothetical protein